MINLGQNLKTDIRLFFHNLIHHFFYSVFIVIVASATTVLLIEKWAPNFISSEISKNLPSQSNMVVLPASGDSLYIEKGSPYDNRTVDGATQSANVIFHGSRDKKDIAITFDAEMTDGMKADLVSGKVKSSYDKRITDILDQTNTKATFFLTGLWIELYPDITTQLAKDPLFELGSHSYTDSSYYGFCYGLKQLSNTIKVEDIGATEKLLREHTGVENRLFRFPGGCYTPSDVALVNEANDVVVHWDVSGSDGFNSNTQQIVRNVVDNTQNGSIIILHLNGSPNAPKTADALSEIIPTLKKKGFNFVKVSELLNISPGKKN